MDLDKVRGVRGGTLDEEETRRENRFPHDPTAVRRLSFVDETVQVPDNLEVTVFEESESSRPVARQIIGVALTGLLLAALPLMSQERNLLRFKFLSRTFQGILVHMDLSQCGRKRCCP